LVKCVLYGIMVSGTTTATIHSWCYLSYFIVIVKRKGLIPTK